MVATKAMNLCFFDLFTSKNFYAKILLLVSTIIFSINPNLGIAGDKILALPNNFGLPGIIDLPTAKRFPDGELVITQQLHKSLARSGISFQALPRVGLAFRYTGHGLGGYEAYGRINHDRSFDAHLSLLDESKYLPAISIGLRDFIGTGWYSSEYIVGTKSIKNIEITAGLGFGRLAGKNSFANPMGSILPELKTRGGVNFGKGGSLGNVNWFQGNASAFYGLNYRIGEKILISTEYSPDLMSEESLYLNVESQWNFGIKYKLNQYLGLSIDYLHGDQVSITANVSINPDRPPLKGAKELPPLPMRLRDSSRISLNQNNNEQIIRKVLEADKFELHALEFTEKTVKLDVTNTKFRSVSQAVGRLASTLQRFTSNNVKFAYISFHSGDLQVATYKINLEEITSYQFSPNRSDLSYKNGDAAIKSIDLNPRNLKNPTKRLSWGLGPYFAHRLFNPDLPLSMETGLEFTTNYRFLKGFKISGAFRKSLSQILLIITADQIQHYLVFILIGHFMISRAKRHIHELKLSYIKNIGPGFYARTHAGLLEPFFAGIGGEFLFKPINSPFGVGIDIHHVQKRNYDMLFNLLDYTATIGHLSLYYDAGGMFDLEINAGKYLAGDMGVTTTISRVFGNGWEVGGYVTLTDVPFETFGEGSFDKAIFFSVPLDWITSKPKRTKRRLTLRPITRDGGANLASARSLYRQVVESQRSNFVREIGRLWK